MCHELRIKGGRATMRLALPIIGIKVLCEHVLTPWKKSLPSTWTRSHRPPRIVKHKSRFHTIGISPQKATNKFVLYFYGSSGNCVKE